MIFGNGSPDSSASYARGERGRPGLVKSVALCAIDVVLGTKEREMVSGMECSKPLLFIRQVKVAHPHLPLSVVC